MLNQLILLSLLSPKVYADCKAQTLCTKPPLVAAAPGCVVDRRAAIDLGSGSIKMTLADVQTCGTQVTATKIPIDEPQFSSRAIGFLESTTHKNQINLTEENQKKAIQIIETFKEYAFCMGAAKYTGVATHAVREALNQSEFVKRLHETTGLDKIRVIPQKEEGRFGFDGAMKELAGDTTCNSNNSVVWDIGGGSTQITYGTQGAQMEGLKWGSQAFKQLVIDSKPRARLVRPPGCASEGQTPNPIGDWSEVQKYIKKASRLIKENGGKEFAKRIREFQKANSGCIVGVGGVHYNATLKAIEANWDQIVKIKRNGCDKMQKTPRQYTKRQVLCLTEYLAKEGDCGKVFAKDEFAPSNVTNLILVAAYLEQFGVSDDQPIRAIKVDMTNQLLTQPSQQQFYGTLPAPRDCRAPSSTSVSSSSGVQ